MELRRKEMKYPVFITNVGLITSKGEEGDNIMAAEWTYQVSYNPGLMAVGIGKGKTTLDNIRENGLFGISIASENQNVLTSVAGGSHGKDIDKIAALEELGYSFF